MNPKKKVSKQPDEQSQVSPMQENELDVDTKQDSSNVVEPSSHIAKTKTGCGLAWGALLCSLLALGAGAYAAWQTTLKGQIITTKVDAYDDRLKLIVADQQGLKVNMADLSSQTNSVSESVKGEVSQLTQELRGINSLLLEVQASSNRSIDDIKASLGDSVAKWKLDEIHSLLSRTNQSYVFTGDKHHALRGLKIAKVTLSTIDDPKLATVKTALAEDIIQLEASQQLDVVALNDRLVGLTTLIAGLPLMEDKYHQAKQAVQPKSQQAEKMDKEEGFLSVGKSLLSDLGSMVKHKKLDAPLKPSLDSDARFALFQSLQLNIQAAMVSLLRRNNAVYYSQLTQAVETMKAYFDIDNTAVMTALSELTSLAGQDINLKADSANKAIVALNRVISLND